MWRSVTVASWKEELKGGTLELGVERQKGVLSGVKLETCLTEWEQFHRVETDLVVGSLNPQKVLSRGCFGRRKVVLVLLFGILF